MRDWNVSCTKISITRPVPAPRPSSVIGQDEGFLHYGTPGPNNNLINNI